MADIEVVIKIPEEDYEYIKNSKDFNFNVIKNGTLLPKGHGDLIDRDKIISDGINKGFCDWYDEIKYAPTILDTDKESEEI